MNYFMLNNGGSEILVVREVFYNIVKIMKTLLISYEHL